MSNPGKIERKPLPGSRAGGGPNSDNVYGSSGGGAQPPLAPRNYETMDAGEFNRHRMRDPEAAATVLPPPPYETEGLGGSGGMLPRQETASKDDDNDDAASTTSVDTVEQELLEFQRREAEECISARDWEGAEETIVSLMGNMTLNSKEKDRWAVQYAKALAAQGRWKEVSEALKGVPDWGESKYLIAKSYLRQGELEKATEACSKAMKLQRKNNDPAPLANDTIALMVEVMEAMGKKVEARFYKSKLPSDAGAPPKYQKEITKDVQDLLKKHSVVYDPKKSYLEGGRDNIVNLWEHAMQKNTVELAEICMSDPRIAKVKRSTDGMTALHLAAQQDKPKYISPLYHLGANIEALAKDWNEGTTPLLCAAKAGFVEPCQELLKLGASISTQDASGWMGLHYAAWNNSLALIRFLVSKRAPMELKNSSGWSPLNVAARWGSKETIQLLLDSGSNINSMSTDESTALLISCRDNNSAKVELLINKGLNLEAKNKEGLTALHNATRHSSPAMVLFLLSKGSFLSALGISGMTPLHLAVWNDGGADQSIEVAKVLIEAGININTMTINDNTARSLAKREKNTKLEDYLGTLGGKY